MRIKITAQDIEDWEGSLEEIEGANPYLPEFVQRRIAGLKLGEEIRVKFDVDLSRFNIRRTR